MDYQPSANGYHDEERGLAGRPSPDAFDPERDFMPVGRLDKHAYGLRQRKMLGTLMKQGIVAALRGKPASVRTLTRETLKSFLDQRTHGPLAQKTHAAGGYEDPERAQRTAHFFLLTMLLNLRSDLLRDAMQRLDDKHLQVGVTREHDGDVEVAPHYETGFLYSMSALIERVRDWLEQDCDVKRDSREGREAGEQIVAFWYGVAAQVGLRRAPRGLAAHERFVAHCEKENIASATPASIKSGQTVAHAFVPQLAEIVGESPREFLKGVRPEILEQLGLDPEQWSDEVQKPETPKPSHTVRWVGQKVWESVNHLLHGDPAPLRALRVLYKSGEASRAARAVFAFFEQHPETKARLRYIKLEPGKAILEEGVEDADGMYILLDVKRGEKEEKLEVVAHDADGEEVPVATLAKGDVAGEIRMLKGGKRTATVRVPLPKDGKTPEKPMRVRMLVLPPEVCASLFKFPLFRSAVIGNVAKRLKQTTNALQESLQSKNGPLAEVLKFVERLRSHKDEFLTVDDAFVERMIASLTLYVREHKSKTPGDEKLLSQLVDALDDVRAMVAYADAPDVGNQAKES